MKNNYIVEKFSNLIDQHEECRLESYLNLRADENFTSSKVNRALGSDLSNGFTTYDTDSSWVDRDCGGLGISKMIDRG